MNEDKLLDNRMVEEEQVVEVTGIWEKISNLGSKSRPAPGWGSEHVIEFEVVAEIFTPGVG